MVFTPTHPHDVWRPSHMAIAEFQAAMIFIIVVTVDVWYTLRHYPAISFIGLEMNDHPAMRNPLVLQPIQSNSFGTGAGGLSAGSKKENQPLKQGGMGFGELSRTWGVFYHYFYILDSQS